MILPLSSPPPAAPNAAPNAASCQSLAPSADETPTGAFDQLIQQAIAIGMDEPARLVQPAALTNTTEAQSSKQDPSPSDAVAAILPPMLPITWQIPAALAVPLGIGHHEAQASSQESASPTSSSSDEGALTDLIAMKPSATTMSIELAPMRVGSKGQGSNAASTGLINADAKTAETVSSALQADAAPAWSSLMTNLTDRGATAPAASHTTLSLNASQPQQWREPLLNTLGERVQWHMQKGLDQAVIRLDPPHLGRVDIVIRQADGVMQVQLSATHHEVAQQLQNVSGGLQQELSMRHTAEVNVQVSDQSRGSDAQQGRQHKDEPARQPGRALNDSGESLAQASAFSMQAGQG